MKKEIMNRHNSLRVRVHSGLQTLDIFKVSLLLRLLMLVMDKFYDAQDWCAQVDLKSEIQRRRVNEEQFASFVLGTV